MKTERKPALERYLGIISAYEREFKKWDSRVEKILKRYRDDSRTNQSGEGEAKFNILWSNVNVLVPACYSRLPQPDVSRRFRDNDPVARVSGLILERALEYEIQHYPDYRATMKQAVYDRFIGGRGSAWARYEPHIRAAQEQLPVDGAEITEDVAAPQEELDYECAPVDYVHWRDFGHTVARTWEEVGQVWRRVYMQMPAKIERFGEKLAEKIPKDAKPKDGRSQQTGRTESSGAADDGSWIYELWDKDKKRAYWFHKSMKDLLDERKDPLGLEGFFPCPKPLFATLTNDSLVPVPDFTLYQDQAKTLDVLADRIDGLAKMLQVKGVYDGAADKAVGRLFTEGGNGNLIPVKNWAAFAEKNGLKGQVDVFDLTPIFQALQAAYECFEQEKNQVYELTGISDIVRGESEASETLGAQQIKQNFVGLRLRNMQTDVAIFATELLQLKAQIMCAKFDPQTLAKISAAEQLSAPDQELLQPAMALLVGEARLADPEADPGPNPLRAFRIEVAADSLVQIDEQTEKENRMEFLKANGAFMKEALPVAQAAPQIAPLIVEMWKFGVSAFKVGKSIEGVFDQTLDQLKELAKQPQPQKPDPDMAKVQAQTQSEAARLQADQQEAAARMQMEDRHAQLQHSREMEKLAAESAFKEREAQRAMQLAQFQKQAEIDLEKWKTVEDNRTKIEVAELSAKAALSTAEAKAASDAAQNKAVQDTELQKARMAEDGKDRDREAQSKSAESQASATREQKPPHVEIHNHIPAAANKKIKKTGDGEYVSSDA